MTLTVDAMLPRLPVARPRNVRVFGVFCESHGVSLNRVHECGCEGTVRLYRALHADVEV